MKILVIGGNGQLGRELAAQGRPKGFLLKTVDLPEIDITSETSIRSVSEAFQPELVINAAAYTQVDRAEAEPDLCRAVNCDGPRNLARCCREIQIPLIHVSTDFVFDGKKTTPYTEEDPPAPLSVYGRTKMDGERAVQANIAHHLIVRTAWLYSVHGQNFVQTMLKLGAERNELGVVDDQYGCPTCAADLAAAILAMAQHIADSRDISWGIYHYCGQGVASWCGFARKIFELAGRHQQFKLKRIKPLTTAQYPTAAARPANSALDCSKITAHFGIRTIAWQESLEKTISRIYAK